MAFFRKSYYSGIEVSACVSFSGLISGLKPKLLNSLSKIPILKGIYGIFPVLRIGQYLPMIIIYIYVEMKMKISRNISNFSALKYFL